MLQEYLANGNLTDLLQEDQIPGVQVYQVELPVIPKVNMDHRAADVPSACMEILFCQEGRLLAELSEDRLLTVEEQETLMVSDVPQLRSMQVIRNLKGILVTVEVQTARDYFVPACTATGLKLDAAFVKVRMEAQKGYWVLSDKLWSQVLFEHLGRLPETARGRYCIFKTVELLYLLCMKSASPKEEVVPGNSGYIVRSIIDARAYMESHLSEKLTISDLSDRFSISPTSLKSGFRRMHGTTIHRWLMEQRMKRARELLQSTDMTIQQIAQMVGYDGVSQFNVIFKQYYGLTPGQFAKMSETVKTCPFH